MVGTQDRIPEEFERLIAQLESAEEGGLKLDTMICYAVAGGDLKTRTLRDVVLEGGFSPDVAGELLDDRPPPFTQAVDPVVPGENIVLSAYSERRGRWVAVQRETDGGEFLAWGANEALARRAAALKAFAQRSLAQARSEPPNLSVVAPEVEPPKEVEPDSGAADNDESGIPEWRIKF